MPITALLPKPDNKENILVKNAGNADIITAIHSMVPEATADVKLLAKKLDKGTPYKTAFAIWYFLRVWAKYVRDAAERQQIRYPRRFIFDTLAKNNSGDCKSFSLFTVSILRALGLPAYFKYAGYAPDSTHPSHVYSYTLDKNGQPIYIDGCYPFFNREKPYTYSKTENMTVTSLSGVLAGTGNQKAKAAAARQFLNSLEPAQRKKVLNAFRRYCEVKGLGRGQHISDVMAEDFPILGLEEQSDVIAGSEPDVIAGRKKKKQKLTPEQKAARKKKRRAKAKAAGKKFLWGVAFVNLLPIRAAFNAIVAANFNAFANNLKWIYENRNGKTKEEWKKISKIWRNVGGLEKALLKAIQLGTKHKPLFLSKKAKSRFQARQKKLGIKGIGAICLDDIQGIGAAPVIAAAIAAASGIIAALIPVVMKALKKGGAEQQAAAETVQEQGQQMVADYKAQGSPKPMPAPDLQQGADGEPGTGEGEEMEGLGALDQDGLNSLFNTLGQVAQVGIQAAGNAVAKKAKKNPKLNKVLNTAGNATEDYFTGKYLREGGYTAAAKKYSKAVSSPKTLLYVGGAAVLALGAMFVFMRRGK